jgi:hypothetical protein
MRGFLSWMVVFVVVGGGRGEWWEERCAANYDCSARESVFPGHDAEFGGE